MLVGVVALAILGGDGRGFVISLRQLELDLRPGLRLLRERRGRTARAYLNMLKKVGVVS